MAAGTRSCARRARSPRRRRRAFWTPEHLTEAAFAGALDTGGLPDPDLVIRTSGETRTSNFLPWQAAYAEYEFTGTLWPDFSPEELAAIVQRFSNRDRRFGGVQANDGTECSSCRTLGRSEDQGSCPPSPWLRWVSSRYGWVAGPLRR
jgi:hypothetical protein